MTDNVNLNQVYGTNTDLNIGSTSTSSSDIQLVFAQLQMELASTNKESAMEKIQGIKANQAQQKKMVDAINDLRNSIAGLNDDKKCAYQKLQDAENILSICKEMGINPPINMNDFNKLKNAANLLQTAIDKANGGYIHVASINGINEVRQTCRDLNIDVTTKHYPNYTNISTRDLLGVRTIGWADVSTADTKELQENILNSVKNLFKESSVAQVKTLITQLESKKDTIGSDVQQEMVLIQDFMGKYSAYTNGATSQISKHADTLTSVATGR